jgi:H+/Cl- antiporter ClcA
MNGVEILNQYPEVLIQFNIRALFISVAIGLIAGLAVTLILIYIDAFSGKSADKESDVLCYKRAILCAVLGVLVGIQIGIKRPHEVMTGRQVYEVILDEEVSLTEFTNTYEILEQRGKLYVVVMKNSDMSDDTP